MISFKKTSPNEQIIGKQRNDALALSKRFWQKQPRGKNI